MFVRTESGTHVRVSRWCDDRDAADRMLVRMQEEYRNEDTLPMHVAQDGDFENMTADEVL